MGAKAVSSKKAYLLKKIATTIITLSLIANILATIGANSLKILYSNIYSILFAFLPLLIGILLLIYSNQRIRSLEYNKWMEENP